MSNRLKGRRALVTRAQDFMGPAIIDVFKEEGADVLADTRDLRPVPAAAELIESAGEIDILIVNLKQAGMTCGTVHTPSVSDRSDSYLIRHGHA